MRRMFGFMIGIAVGGLVGSTIALLLAPEAGEELRGQLRERGQNFFNDVRHAADERRIEPCDPVEAVRRVAGDQPRAGAGPSAEPVPAVPKRRRVRLVNARARSVAYRGSLMPVCTVSSAGSGSGAAPATISRSWSLGANTA